MAAERTRRLPKRPRAYVVLVALAALTLAAGVAGTLKVAQTPNVAVGGIAR